MESGDISDADLLTLIHGWAAIGGASPLDALAVMYAESGFHPSARNSSGCLGLNQFCPSSGVALPDNYTELSAADQLTGYIFPWFAQKPRAALQSARDLYWVNALPGLYVPGKPDNYVVTSDPGQVHGILGPGPTVIQAGDFSALIAKRTDDARFHELAQRIVALGGAPRFGPLGLDFTPLFVLGAAGAGAIMLARRKS